MRLLLATLLCATGCVPSAKAPALSGAVLAQGQAVEAAALMSRAEGSVAVCVGERHDDAKHHRVQHQLLEALAERSDATGVRLALGMEMFRRHMQPALNAYYDGEIDAQELKRETDWDKSWGFDFAMYEPMLDTARRHRVRIIGLNAPRALTRAVARRGLEALSPEVRDSLPQLVLDDANHRAFFWAVMGFGEAGGEGGGEGHGHGASKAESFYAAQVIWDETMAESVSAWLSDPEPRRMVVVAGNGHCHRSAVPNRVQRRQKRDVVSVLLRSPGDEPTAHAESDFVIEVH